MNKTLIFLFAFLIISCSQDASKRVLSEGDRAELIDENETRKLKNQAKQEQERLEWEQKQKAEENQGQNYYLAPRQVFLEDAGRFQAWGERGNALLDTKTGDVYFLEEAKGEKIKYRWRRQVEFSIKK